MNRVRIGITCSEIDENKRSMQSVNEDYIDAIIKAGGIPFLLPICDEEKVIQYQVEGIDGLLVTGGIDMNPLFYHENYCYKQGESSYRRDAYEMKLIQYAYQFKKPIFGICRGQQAINVAFGGSLYQDNSLAGNHVMQHTQLEKRAYPSHKIDIMEDSFLTPIFGKTAYVNSFHHQSIKTLAEHFRVVARSDDQIIEAIEHINQPIWAVQFHPESMRERDEKMHAIFEFFVKEVVNRRD